MNEKDISKFCQENNCRHNTPKLCLVFFVHLFFFYMIAGLQEENAQGKALQQMEGVYEMLQTVLDIN